MKTLKLDVGALKVTTFAAASVPVALNTIDSANGMCTWESDRPRTCNIDTGVY